MTFWLWLILGVLGLGGAIAGLLWYAGEQTSEGEYE